LSVFHQCPHLRWLGLCDCCVCHLYRLLGTRAMFLLLGSDLSPFLTVEGWGAVLFFDVFFLSIYPFPARFWRLSGGKVSTAVIARHGVFRTIFSPFWSARLASTITKWSLRCLHEPFPLLLYDFLFSASAICRDFSVILSGFYQPLIKL